MTKKEFLQGEEFVGTISSHNRYRFQADSNVSAENIKTTGHINIRQGKHGTWAYYANVSKVSNTNINLYFCGINKMNRESLKLAELEMTGE